MKINFNLYCICGNQDCFSVQTQLCQFVTTAGNDAKGATTDVWCEPRPISIRFSPLDSTYKTWLYLLSCCHHIRGFKETFIAAAVAGLSSGAPTTSTSNWFINRIHFPRALLENRSTQKIFQNQTLMSAAVTDYLKGFDDGKDRMMEPVNTVEFLEKLAKQILVPVALFEAFRSSKKNNKFDKCYVQAPVGALNDAKLYLAALLNSRTKLSINRNEPQANSSCMLLRI